jgi:predicted N-acyltransferase
MLVEAALELARQTEMSSLHCLFPSAEEIDVWRDCGMMTRRTVQFHWQNDGFADFNDFLSRMNHSKRKKIRQERRRLSDNGVTCERVPGNEASAEDWLFFNKCYRRTYREHLSTPYLNLDFFRTIGESIPDNLLLIFARRDGERIAAALNVIGNNAMYGRYWGTTEFQRGLHFEVCYYQGIEHCIAHGIGRFEGGAQGEHKLARGLMPTEAISAHWLAHPEFAQAGWRTRNLRRRLKTIYAGKPVVSPITSTNSTNAVRLRSRPSTKTTNKNKTAVQRARVTELVELRLCSNGRPEKFRPRRNSA